MVGFVELGEFAGFVGAEGMACGTWLVACGDACPHVAAEKKKRAEIIAV
jgi:hypothetical protein